MLYFSKIKIILIYLVITFLSYFCILNFIESTKIPFSNKKVNLGLDLQGGSYLLLEMDISPVLTQKLQSKILLLRKELKKNQIQYQKISLMEEKIFIETNSDFQEKISDIINSKDNSVNFYLNKYKSFELESNFDSRGIYIYFTKFGIVDIKNSSLEHSIEIVRRRIDEIGTKEPTILRRGSNRILIELPGLDEPSRIKKLLGKTANLTFRFVVEGNESEFGTETLINDNTGNNIKIGKRVILNGDNLIDAQPRIDSQTKETVVSFKLDRLGSKRFAKATSKNVGRRLAIVLDNRVISAPSIREAITGGNGQISGNFTFQSATDLALLLRSGALPAPLNIIEERTVGPDLGEDSIKAGTISLIIGFVLVILFMALKYRFFGLIADASLIVNLFLLVGILTILGATLTLPGIAGIILTVGMAVDANVLIFERIKEELKLEKNKIFAFDRGYNKAKSAILDANITTLISAIILFFLGSGPVKGFAVTLAIGICTTLFSAYFFARHISSTFVMKNKDKDIKV